MAEYIDKEQLLSDLYSKQDDENLDVMLEIANFPAADVAPVVHGRWEWHKDHWECSNCRGNRFHDLALGLDAAYCGYCGAKTDGEKKEDRHEFE